MEQAKKWYFSKTILTNILMGVAMIAAVFVPDVAAFIREYFAEAGMGWALLNIVLRLITKQELQA